MSNDSVVSIPLDAGQSPLQLDPNTAVSSDGQIVISPTPVDVGPVAIDGSTGSGVAEPGVEVKPIELPIDLEKPIEGIPVDPVKDPLDLGPASVDNPVNLDELMTALNEPKMYATGAGGGIAVATDVSVTTSAGEVPVVDPKPNMDIKTLDDLFGAIKTKNNDAPAKEEKGSNEQPKDVPAPVVPAAPIMTVTDVNSTVNLTIADILKRAGLNHHEVKDHGHNHEQPPAPTPTTTETGSASAEDLTGYNNILQIIEKFNDLDKTNPLISKDLMDLIEAENKIDADDSGPSSNTAGPIEIVNSSYELTDVEVQALLEKLKAMQGTTNSVTGSEETPVVTVPDTTTPSNVTEDKGTAEADNIIVKKLTAIVYGLDGDDMIMVDLPDDLVIPAIYPAPGMLEAHGGKGSDIILASMDIAINDKLYGDEGSDLIKGYGGENLIEGGAGNDHLSGNMDKDVINGGAGNDDIHGGKEKDILTGDDGNDSIFGGMDNDNIRGGEGDDNLYGGEGDDELHGGAGVDFIEGQQGADHIWTGAGSDMISMKNAAGHDVVYDFDKAEDHLVFTSAQFTNLDLVHKAMDQKGDDVVVTIDSNNSVTIKNALLADMISSSAHIEIIPA